MADYSYLKDWGIKQLDQGVKQPRVKITRGEVKHQPGSRGRQSDDEYSDTSSSSEEFEESG